MPSLFRRISALWKKEQPEAPLPPTTELHSSPAPALSSTPTVPHYAAAQPLDLSQPLSEDLVFQALRKCRDPEIPVNIVDLGLIYDVRIAEDLVNVKMTLTTQGCGMGGYISQEAEEQIRSLPGVREARVEIVWDPPWNPSMISEAGRKVLGLPE
jgi:metal-sulfur cluster biosynthetic enzyme